MLGKTITSSQTKPIPGRPSSPHCDDEHISNIVELAKKGFVVKEESIGDYLEDGFKGKAKRSGCNHPSLGKDDITNRTNPHTR